MENAHNILRPSVTKSGWPFGVMSALLSSSCRTPKGGQVCVGEGSSITLSRDVMVEGTWPLLVQLVKHSKRKGN